MLLQLRGEMAQLPLPAQGWSWNCNDMMEASVDVSPVTQTVKQQITEQHLMLKGISSIVWKYSCSKLKVAYEYEAYLSQTNDSRLRKALKQCTSGSHRLQRQPVQRVKDPAQTDETQ